MPRTLDQIVQEYVDYVEQQQELADEPTREIPLEELQRRSAEWVLKMQDLYPNGFDTAEVEQAAQRWEETENVAQGVLGLLAQMDQKDAKVEELRDEKERLEAEL